MGLNSNDQNDLSSFNKLFVNYQTRFIRFALTYVEDRMTAEDIVMESMMYYWENRMRISHETDPAGYIFTSIKNKCLNFLRDSQYHKVLSEQLKEHFEWQRSLSIATLEACDPAELFSKEIQSIINKSLARLPKTTREIFIMRRFEEKSFLEIALEMNMSVKGVEYHMAKATVFLKKELKDFIPILTFLLLH